MKIPKLYLTTTPSGGSFVYGLTEAGTAWYVQVSSNGEVYCLTTSTCPPEVGISDNGWVTQELIPAGHSTCATDEFVRACEDLGV